MTTAPLIDATSVLQREEGDVTPSHGCLRRPLRQSSPTGDLTTTSTSNRTLSNLPTILRWRITVSHVLPHHLKARTSRRSGRVVRPDFDQAYDSVIERIS